VKALPLGSRVIAQSWVDLAEPAKIIDVPEQVPLRILRACAAEITADAPISGRALHDGSALDRHPTQQKETATVNNLAAEPIEHRPERRQRKILSANVGDIEVPYSDNSHRFLDLGDLRWRETVAPFVLPPAEVGAYPGRGPSISGRGGNVWGDAAMFGTLAVMCNSLSGYSRNCPVFSPGLQTSSRVQAACFSTMSAAFSPIMIDGALVLPEVSVGHD